MPDVIAIDFETFYSKKLKYSVKSMIAEQYCRHPLFDPYLVSVSDGKTCWAGSPKDFNWACLAGKTVIAHNLYFDKSVLIEMERRGMVPAGTIANVKEWHCTANMCSYLCFHRALADAVEHLLGIKLSKDVRDDASGKHWPKDFNAEQQKAMIEYARRDAHYCWLLFDKFSSQWPEFERKLSQHSIDCGMYGAQIDRDLLETYIIQSHEMKTNTEKLLPWLAGAEEVDDWSDWAEENDIKARKPTSTKCIAEQCRRSGIPCCPVKSDDQEAYDEWENTYAPQHPWIYALSSWRSVNKLYKSFMTIKERLRSDGTMPFDLKYFGGHTGRWSGAGRLNMQNMPRLPMICNQLGLIETNEVKIHEALKEKRKGAYPLWVKYAIDMRNLFIPRPGYKMIPADLSQIEPRVLAWLAQDTVMLDSMAKGDSPYVAHARATMKFIGGDLKGEAPDQYALAKARVLALGFQAGWEKFIAMAKAMAGLDVTKDDPETIEVENPVTGEKKTVSGYGYNAKRIVAEFREQNPKIVALWNRLDQQFKSSVGSDFVMTLPSGRKMTYRRVRCETRIEPDKETGQPRRRSVFTAEIGKKRVITYGGKLTENITQATAREIFGLCLLALEAAGIRVLFSVHDEAVTEVRPEVTVSQIEEIMSRPVPWMPGLRVGVEAHEVACYCK